MKKIIIYLTIFSFLNLVGCYYQQQMNPSEYNFDENLDLQVTTKDTVYSISGDDYFYANDTLFAKVPVQLDKRTSAKLKVNIPVETIETVEVEKTDVVATVFTTLGVIVGVFAIVVGLSLSDGLYQ
jgi:hypothetical protein